MQAHGVLHWQIRVHYEMIGRDVAISVIYRRRSFCKASPDPTYLHGYLQGRPHHDSWCFTVKIEVCDGLSLIWSFCPSDEGCCWARPPFERIFPIADAQDDGVRNDHVSRERRD
jgi:hypothetical protein